MFRFDKAPFLFPLFLVLWKSKITRTYSQCYSFWYLKKYPFRRNQNFKFLDFEPLETGITKKMSFNQILQGKNSKYYVSRLKKLQKTEIKKKLALNLLLMIKFL